MTLEHIAGRRYGPVPFTVDPARVAEFVTATSDDPERWAGTAPPGFAAALLFAAAPIFFADDDVTPYTAAMLHSEQRFAWDGPLRGGATLAVTGEVTGVRARRGLNLVTFTAAASGDEGEVVRSVSTFLMSADAAVEDPPPEEEEAPATARAASPPPEPASLPAAGGELEPLARSASRADLVRYAAASGDFNPIHWDHDSARRAGLAGVVVHGLCMASWLCQAAGRYAPGPAPLADLKARFRFPLRPAVAAVVTGRVGQAGPPAVLHLALGAGGAEAVTATATLRIVSPPALR